MFHESLNLASVWSLPVVFVCQNNQYGEHTRYSDTAKNPSVVDRAAAYAMKGIKVDGMDAVATYLAAKEAVDQPAAATVPVLLECVTFRTLGHVLSDKNEYMDQDQLAEQIANDPVPRFRSWMISEGAADDDTLAGIDAAVSAEVTAAYEQAAADPLADPATVIDDNYGSAAAADEPGEDAEPNERLTFRNAINQAMDQALAADDRVFVLGEDVADSAGGGVFHVTDGLSTKHGEDRVRNTPISEEAIMGASVGAAIAGMRPLAQIMFMDFLGVAFDQLANHAAKLRYMSGGRTPVPLTVRVNMVGGTPIGAQHSQSLEALLMHTPGLKVVFPSTPYDAKGLLSPHRGRGPVRLHREHGPVHEAGHGADRALHDPDRRAGDPPCRRRRHDHQLRTVDGRRLEGRRPACRRGHLGRGRRPALPGPARHGHPADVGGQDDASRRRPRSDPHVRSGSGDLRSAARGAARSAERPGAAGDGAGLLGAGAGGLVSVFYPNTDAIVAACRATA